MMTDAYTISIIILNTVTCFVMYMVALYFFFEALMVAVEYWDSFDRHIEYQRYTIWQIGGRVLAYIAMCVILIASANTMLLSSLKQGAAS